MLLWMLQAKSPVRQTEHAGGMWRAAGEQRRAARRTSRRRSVRISEHHGTLRQPLQIRTCRRGTVRLQVATCVVGVEVENVHPTQTRKTKKQKGQGGERQRVAGSKVA